IAVCGLINPHAAIAGRREGIPVVWMITDSRTPTILRRLTMPLVRSMADAVLFNGRALIDLHLGRRSMKLPSFVYYSPVDTNRFTPSVERRLRTRQLLGIPNDAQVVGAVANITPQKGIEYFIRAAAEIHRAVPGTWFLIVGASFKNHAYERQ